MYRPEDEIRQNELSDYEFTYMFISIIEKQESLMRFVITEVFCDHVLSESDKAYLAEMERIAAEKKRNKLLAHNALGDENPDLQTQLVQGEQPDV